MATYGVMPTYTGRQRRRAGNRGGRSSGVARPSGTSSNSSRPRLAGTAQKAAMKTALQGAGTKKRKKKVGAFVKSTMGQFAAARGRSPSGSIVRS
jgi:hypothetical protein